MVGPYADTRCFPPTDSQACDLFVDISAIIYCLLIRLFALFFELSASVICIVPLQDFIRQSSTSLDFFETCNITIIFRQELSMSFYFPLFSFFLAAC